MPVIFQVHSILFNCHPQDSDSIGQGFLLDCYPGDSNVQTN